MNIKKSSSIWIAVFSVFLALSIFHYKQAQENFPYFNTTLEPTNNGMVSSYNAKASASEKRINILTEEINEYIGKYNKNNRQSNLAAFYGYLLSSVLAASSFIREIFFTKKINEQNKPSNKIENNKEQ